MRFHNKTIIVTGGATGIGYQVAKDLYTEGAHVEIIGRREERLQEAVASISAHGGPGIIHYHVCDVAYADQVGGTFKQIVETCGTIYGLVNNAAINPSRNDILHTDISDWDATLAVNLTGAFHCSKAALQHMVTQGSGSVVNISSIAGLHALPTRTSYNVSKFGLLGLTESLAKDYAKHGIRVNSVCPGYVRTELTEPFISAMTPERYAALVRSHPLGRIGQPEDIAKVVLFLLSKDASFITGVALPVDGGYSLGR